MRAVRCKAGLVVVALTVVGVLGEEPLSTSWSADADMRLLFEIIQTVRRKSLPPVDPRKMIRYAIGPMLRTVDDYTRYESPDEVSAAREREISMLGAGVRALITADSRWLLLPFPHGPAEASGILYGDELLAIDGHSVRPAGGESAETLRRLISGDQQRVKRFAVVRRGVRLNLPVFVTTFERKSVGNVANSTNAPFSVIRITDFETKTVRDLYAAIRRAQTVNRPIVLDLRSNTGGDLNEAIDTARLFLPAGRTIVTIERKTSQDTYTTLEAGPFAEKPVLYVFQDRQTASAAEVFIGALVNNGRARSVGQTTQGKGVTQEVVPLSDGGRLVVTNGRLILPGGASFDKVGLNPGRQVLDESPEQWMIELQLWLNAGTP